MGSCHFTDERIIGPNFKIPLDVDQCDVESHRFCEIPVMGPGVANRLVIITGIAVVAADTPDPRTFRGDVYIKTDYIVNPPDQWLGIVNGNATLLQTTYAALADINNESEGESLFAVDEASTQRNTDGRIQVNLRLAAQGDVALMRVSYQACILIRRETRSPGGG